MGNEWKVEVLLSSTDHGFVGSPPGGQRLCIGGEAYAGRRGEPESATAF